MNPSFQGTTRICCTFEYGIRGVMHTQTVDIITDVEKKTGRVRTATDNVVAEWLEQKPDDDPDVSSANLCTYIIREKGCMALEYDFALETFPGIENNFKGKPRYDSRK